MAEVTNELIYEVLKQMQERFGKLEGKMDEVRGELTAVRTYIYAEHQDLANIYAILTRQDGRLDRIERRLELRDTAST